MFPFLYGLSLRSFLLGGILVTSINRRKKLLILVAAVEIGGWQGSKAEGPQGGLILGNNL